MQNFTQIINKFHSKELNTKDWNFCYSRNTDYEMSKLNRNRYSLHIMGTGAEQELTCFDQFQTLEQLFGFCYTLGIQDKDIFQIG